MTSTACAPALISITSASLGMRRCSGQTVTLHATSGCLTVKTSAALDTTLVLTGTVGRCTEAHARAKTNSATGIASVASSEQAGALNVSRTRARAAVRTVAVVEPAGCQLFRILSPLGPADRRAYQARAGAEECPFRYSVRRLSVAATAEILFVGGSPPSTKVQRTCFELPQ